MKKLINFRVSLTMAVGFILGIFCCYEWLFGDFYLGFAVALVLTVCITIFAILRNGVWKSLLILLIFALLGFGAGHISYNVLQGEEVCEQSFTITGRVCDIGLNGNDGSHVVYLENCSDDCGATYKGRIRFTFAYYDGEIHTGDLLTVKGVLSSTYPVQSQVQTYYLRNCVYYELHDVTITAQQSGGLKLSETIRLYLYNTTRECMPMYGDIAYALLTGDRNAMTEDITDIFTRAGIIHVLAVSGLHVGFVVALLCLLLRRLRLHPLVECALVVTPLMFYAYICNFAPSILRAVVMVVCSYLAKAVFGRYDLLTSLSWAVVVILLIEPFYLFDVGFQLSILSVYGIATIYAPFDRLLKRHEVSKSTCYLLDGVLISLSCSIATLFTVAVNFQQVPTLSVLLNIVVIPLISIIFALCVFGLIPWIFHYLLIASDYMLQVVVWLAQKVAQLDFATVSVVAISICVLFAVILLFVIGGFVNLKRLSKMIVCSSLALMIVVGMVVAVVPRKTAIQVHVCYGYNDVMTVATSDDGEMAIVGDYSDYYATSDAVAYADKYSVDSCTLYIVHFNKALSTCVSLVIDSLPVDKVYVLDTTGNDKAQQVLQNSQIDLVYQLPNSSQGNDVRVKSLYDAGISAVTVTVGNIKACTVYSEGERALNVPKLLPDCDIYLLKEANRAYSDANLTTLSLYQAGLQRNYGANKYGNFTIKQKSGKILLTFR